VDTNENAKSVAPDCFQNQDFLSRFISKKQVVNTALNIARNARQKSIEFESAKLIPKSQQILSSASQMASSQVTTPNLNNLIAGSGQWAIKSQDLVRRLNQ